MPSTEVERITPVFIGGCERSGTTLLGSMLGAGREAFVTPESPFKIRILSHTGAADQLLKELSRDYKFSTWSVELQKNGAFSHIAESSNREMLETIIFKYQADRGTKKRIWIDHTPSNLSNIPLLARAFPEARFIHIVRDGRAVAASFKNLSWGPANIVEAADWWKDRISIGFWAEATFPGKVWRVRFEDLIEHPEDTLKDLCKKLELDFSENMLTGEAAFLPAYTRKQHALIGTPPDVNQLTKWQRELAPWEIRFFEYKAFELLKVAGYLSPEKGRSGPGIDRRDLLKAYANALTTKITRRFGKR